MASSLCIGLTFLFLYIFYFILFEGGVKEKSKVILINAFKKTLFI
jgi:hypothetical protein